MDIFADFDRRIIMGRVGRESVNKKIRKILLLAKLGQKGGTCPPDLSP